MKRIAEHFGHRLGDKVARRVTILPLTQIMGRGSLNTSVVHVTGSLGKVRGSVDDKVPS